MRHINLAKKKVVAKKTNKPSAKVNDVAKPGETPASANARPTITGHQTLVKNDPMVSTSSQEEETPEDDKKTAYLKKSKPKIIPISDDLKSKQKETESEQPEEKPELESEESQPEQDANSDTAAIDAVAQSAETKSEAEAGEEDQKRKQQIDELVRSGKYRLPILEGGHKGSAERLVSWMFLLLLLSSVGVYLAVDAGYINIGFDLPFEFIKN